MKKTIISILTVTFVVITLAGCSGEEATREKVLRDQPLKEITVFRLGVEKPDLSLRKSGIASSSIIADVSPQITGQIIEINVKVGQSVKEGDNLLILGESLSTDLINLQYETAANSKNLAEKSKYTTNLSGKQSINAAEIAVETALEGYKNAKKSRKNSEDLFLEQRDNTKIELENTEKAYKNAKNNYSSIRDQLKDLEKELIDIQSQIEDFKNETESQEILKELKSLEKELKSSISGIKTQEDNARFAKNIAENRIEQAEIAINQMETGFNSQLDQLDYYIEIASKQYEAAINQLDSVKSAVQLQENGVESQLLQAKSGLDSAELNKEYQTIKAPISGKITSITAKEGNFTAPGQILITIEDDRILSVKTSLIPEEAELLSVGDSTIIESNSETIKGAIKSISPSTNEISKKINVEIEVKNHKKITAGSFVKINFKLDMKNIFFIPLNSIFPKEKSKFLKIVNSENKIEITEVSVGKIIGNFIEITDGLKGDEQITIAGTNFLEEGEKVKIANLLKVKR